MPICHVDGVFDNFVLQLLVLALDARYSPNCCMEIRSTE